MDTSGAADASGAVCQTGGDSGSVNSAFGSTREYCADRIALPNAKRNSGESNCPSGELSMRSSVSPHCCGVPVRLPGHTGVPAVGGAGTWADMCACLVLPGRLACLPDGATE